MANLLKMHLMQLLLIKWHIQMIYLDLKTMCNTNLKLGVNGKVAMLTMKTIWNIGKNSYVDCLNLGKTNYRAKTNFIRNQIEKEDQVKALGGSTTSLFW